MEPNAPLQVLLSTHRRSGPTLIPERLGCQSWNCQKIVKFHRLTCVVLTIAFILMGRCPALAPAQYFHDAVADHITFLVFRYGFLNASRNQIPEGRLTR
jgi:hypothetical protein